MEEKDIYFAYGSNMSEEQMQERKIMYSARIRAVLPGYLFKFNKRSQRNHDEGFANIAKNDQTKVYGWLYFCAPGSLKTLDKFEGVAGGHYKRTAVTVFPLHANTILTAEPYEAITYVALPGWIGDHLYPSKGYRNKILDNLGSFPNDYVQHIRALAYSHHGNEL